MVLARGGAGAWWCWRVVVLMTSFLHLCQRFGYTPLLLMPKQNSHPHSIDLLAIAHQTMIEAGFVPDFSAAVKIEVDSLARKPRELSAPGGRDLRALLWSSIDDSKSRDLDQIEYAEALSNGD